jgi:hypothetical protein
VGVGSVVGRGQPKKSQKIPTNPGLVLGIGGGVGVGVGWVDGGRGGVCVGGRVGIGSVVGRGQPKNTKKSQKFQK